MSKDDFKKFVNDNPHLASYVNSNKMTWQKFYEMYDLYGKDSKVWDEYTKDRSLKINDIIKNVDVNSIKEHINTAQKALDFVQELTSKTPKMPNVSNVSPRPINKFFED